jgi:hypothetical protein
MELDPTRTWLMDTAREAGKKLYDPVQRICLIPRETIWYAISLLFDEDEESRALGNMLLRGTVSTDGTHTPATLIAVCRRIPGRLEPGVVDILEARIRDQLVSAAMVEWHDGNVNHPLAAWCTLICGGEMAGQSWAVELGHRRLSHFQKTIGDRRFRFRRQAEMSEYNSLTYTALDLWFLALMAEHAEHKEARALALFLEHRLWVDVAMHFHAPSCQFAGPHSRSYQEDSSGGFSALHCTMMAAFGTDLYVNAALPVRYNHPSNLIENALVAITPFHVPVDARRIALGKPFPYHFRMTTYCESYHENSRRSTTDGEIFAFDDEIYAGGLSDLTTYMTEEYALGSASRPYVNAGHSDGMVVRMRRNGTIHSMSDFRSLYTRGVFNDSTVGRKNYSHVARCTIDESYLTEEGRCAVYQHEHCAIVCYTPKRAGHEGIRAFRLDLIFGYDAPFDHLVIGGDTSAGFPSVHQPDARLIFQDGNTYGVITLLPAFPSPDAAPVRLWKTDEHMILSQYNRNGTNAEDIPREELGRWRTGFVIEMATVGEFGSFDRFLTHARSVRVEEFVGHDCVRSIHYRTGSHEMLFRYDPIREQILSRQWDQREERIDHMEVTAGGERPLAFCPETLFGSEARGSAEF